MNHGFDKQLTDIKILFLADSRTYHTRRWLSFFAKRGFRVLLYDVLNDPPVMEGVEIVVPKYSDDPETSYPQRLAHILVDLGVRLQEIRPDIVQSHFLVNWGWWGALSGFHPLVMNVWGSDINIGTYNSDFHRRANQLALWQSDLVTANSIELLRKIAALKGDLVNCELIYWAIDTNLFRPKIPTADFRRKYRLGARQLILSPRNLKPNFNIINLIRAFRLLTPRLPKATLIILSYPGLDPAYMGLVVEQVDKFKLKGRVRLLYDLPKEEMATLYNAAEVTISIPDYDSSSVSVLESLACGTPVVASRIAGNEEWIWNGDVGFLVNQHDPQEIADSIEIILGQPELGREMGKKGRHLVLARADVRREWDRMDYFYRQLAKPGLDSRPQRYLSLDAINRYIYLARKEIATGNLNRAFEFYLRLIRDLYRLEPWQIESP